MASADDAFSAATAAARFLCPSDDEDEDSDSESDGSVELVDEEDVPATAVRGLMDTDKQQGRKRKAA